jgi:hypothetical protein
LPWNIPQNTKQLFRQELAGSLTNVNQEKPVLNALLLKHEISTIELFDLYSELGELHGEMNDVSSNTADWGDSSTAIQLAQLGAKTSMLIANIESILRTRIEAQEARLETCGSKPPPVNQKQ